MIASKLLGLFLAVLLALTSMPLYAAEEEQDQPQEGGYRIIVTDQFGNPHDEEYYIQESGSLFTQGFRGQTELGKAYGQFPVGDATVTVAGQTKQMYVHPLVTNSVVFEVEVPLPGSEWLKVHYRGQGPDGRQLFGLYSDYKILYPGRWEVKIFHNGQQLGYTGVLSMMKENAMVIVLPPGEQILQLQARNYDTGTTFSFDKLVEVEAPVAVSYESTIVSASTASVALWIDDTQLPQGTLCKFTVQESQASVETECPRTEGDAVHIALPEGENALKIEAWNSTEQVSAEFQLVVPVKFFHTALPFATRAAS